MSDMFTDIFNCIFMSLKKLSHFLTSREVGLEFIKALITAIFGFITFKIYQLYRNKKDNINLYIQMIKLERELIKNKEKLKKVIDQHKEYNSLKILFNYEERNSLLNLYSQVNSLNSYIYENIIFENGEPADVRYDYLEVQYETIRHLEEEIGYLLYSDKDYSVQIDELKYDIEQLKKR